MLSKLESGETWELVQSGDDPPLARLGHFWTWDFIEMGWLPPPLKSTWEFFELGIFFKRNDPLKSLWNKLNMKNISTKSINMSDIMIYFAMFSTVNDKILGFIGPHKIKK